MENEASSRKTELTRSSNLTWFASLLKLLLGRDLGRFWVWTSILALVYLHNLFPPFVIGQIVNFLTTYHQGDSTYPILAWCALLTGGWIAASVVRIQAKNTLNRIAHHTAYSARVFGFERLMNYSLEWHDSEGTGSKVQRIQAGSNGLREIAHLFQSEVLGVTVACLGVVVSFSLVNSYFGLLAFIYLAAFGLVHRWFYIRIHRVLDESKRASERAAGVYVEGASNILTVKTLNAGGALGAAVREREQTARDLRVKADSIMYWKWRCFQIVNGLSLGVFVYYVASEAAAGKSAPGTVLILFTYFRTLMESAGDSSNFIDGLIDHWTSVLRLRAIFGDHPSGDGGAESFPEAWESIDLTNATARYQGSDRGISSLTLSIRRGERIGVIGESGSGKSTLAKVLLGVRPLESGMYQIGGVPFQAISPEERASHISIVLQDSELFNLSFEENITLMRDVSPELLQNAIRISQLEGLIERLPDGLATVIGEKGYHLSGGERQRIGIARAICRNPEILVLDEATSALDNETESAVHAALMEEMQGRTVVIIAHRLTTLEGVDRVIALDHGIIVRQGSYREVIHQAQ